MGIGPADMAPLNIVPQVMAISGDRGTMIHSYRFFIVFDRQRNVEFSLKMGGYSPESSKSILGWSPILRTPPWPNVQDVQGQWIPSLRDGITALKFYRNTHCVYLALIIWSICRKTIFFVFFVWYLCWFCFFFFALYLYPHRQFLGWSDRSFLLVWYGLILPRFSWLNCRNSLG